MAYANTTGTITLADRFAALRADVKGAIARRRIYRTTLSELSALSDRELSDLGIHRGNIASIAREAAATN